jgi:hypothetical protein
MLMAKFAEVVCEAPGAIGEVTVGKANSLRIGSYMMNSNSLNKARKSYGGVGRGI